MKRFYSYFKIQGLSLRSRTVPPFPWTAFSQQGQGQQGQGLSLRQGQGRFLKIQGLFLRFICFVFLFSVYQTKAQTHIEFTFNKGRYYNHPLFVIWAENTHGKFIETLFVCESIGKSVFDKVDNSSGKWLAGNIQRPASLPYWGHQRGIKNKYGYYLPDEDYPEPDAVSGATPKKDFVLNLTLSRPINEKIRFFFEINQSWDWNEYWHNNRFPDDNEYKTSCQPALIYMVEIDPKEPKDSYILQPIGHSSYNGSDGNLYTDLSTLSTALEITKKVCIKVYW